VPSIRDWIPSVSGDQPKSVPRIITPYFVQYEQVEESRNNNRNSLYPALRGAAPFRDGSSLAILVSQLVKHVLAPLDAILPVAILNVEFEAQRIRTTVDGINHIVVAASLFCRRRDKLNPKSQTLQIRICMPVLMYVIRLLPIQRCWFLITTSLLRTSAPS
jgi:hypothetical protein